MSLDWFRCLRIFRVQAAGMSSGSTDSWPVIG
jgi:hypothetical protein